MLTFGTAKVALTAINGARKVFTVYRDMADAKDSIPDGFLLWQLVQSLEQPMLLAMRLQTRHQSLPFVNAAVTLTRRILQRCEALVSNEHADADEDDDVPEGAAGWKEWFSQKKSDVQLSEHVPLLCRDLQMCSQALQLALVGLQVESSSRIAQHLSVSPLVNWRAPIRFDVDAAESARFRFHEFEYGRTSRCLIGCGNTFGVRNTPVKRAVTASKEDAHFVGFHYVYLRSLSDKRANGEKDEKCVEDVMVLSLIDARCAAESPPNFDESIDLYINTRTRVRRCRVCDLSGLIESDSTGGSKVDDDIVYDMSGEWSASAIGAHRMFLQYESANGVALEEFEALVAMAFCTNQSSKPTSLAEVVDLESIKGRGEFVTEWERVVGPLANEKSTDGEELATPTIDMLKTPKQSGSGDARPSHGSEVDSLKLGKLQLE